MDPITVYRARKVVTLDPARPAADAVAVRGDRVLAVGSLEELSAFDGGVVDDRYADHVVFPGFVEAHAHTGTATAWRSTYVGYFDRSDIEGRRWSACRTFDEVLDRLRDAERALEDPDEPLVAWGLDPIYFPGERLVARHLDLVSATRPIFVLHANAHLATVNSALMRRDGITRDVHVEGVAKDADGEPTGELREMAAMSLATSGGMWKIMAEDRRALLDYGRLARNVGITTIVDLASNSLLDADKSATILDAAGDPEFAVRYAPFHFGNVPPTGSSFDDVIATLRSREGHGNPRLLDGYVKLMLDGSIQSFTARLLEPGYLNHAENGQWNTTPEQFEAAFSAYHEAGFTVHVHCNGDEATELFLDVVGRVLARSPRPGHRHTVTHSQLSTAAQYRRMAALGVGANIFSNHIYYWGDQHHDITLGPDRASRMNAAATALREGVRISLHSDSPVTPLGPLATASYAVDRMTATGRVLGEHERIDVESAVRAMTLGSAYLLGLDDRIGSIEGGKFADFAILGDDPLAATTGAELREIPVVGTVVGGAHYPLPGS